VSFHAPIPLLVRGETSPIKLVDSAAIVASVPNEIQLVTTASLLRPIV
jgi:hypothetical protein